MKSGKIITGALIGVAIGAAIGILFAPDKGSKTRRKLKEGSDNLLGDLKGKYNATIDNITEKLDDLEKQDI